MIGNKYKPIGLMLLPKLYICINLHLSKYVIVYMRNSVKLYKCNCVNV